MFEIVGDSGRDKDWEGTIGEGSASPKDEGELRVCSVSKARRDAPEGMMTPRMPVFGG